MGLLEDGVIWIHSFRTSRLTGYMSVYFLAFHLVNILDLILKFLRNSYTVKIWP